MAADVRDIKPSRTWLRSSSCTPGKNCVEIGHVGTRVVIRDSKSRRTLRGLGTVAWFALLTHCRATH
ncbi:MAG TPA: DUF397 domain-containing protein [Microlunatus sp.]|nr:DUF397 domain-containing protein [Microlunatus sp.]